MLGSIATSVMLAGLTLALLRHAVARGTMARMTHMASYDSLTSLPNRTLFRAQLALGLKDLRRGNGSFALLSLDLDRFKYVNDTLGHQIGDLLLVEVARRIEETLGSSDTVARFGGDEFVVMQTPASQPLEAATLAEKLIAAISERPTRSTITRSLSAQAWASPWRRKTARLSRSFCGIRTSRSTRRKRRGKGDSDSSPPK